MRINDLTDLTSVRQYLSRIGAEPRSLKTAVIKEMHGSYWKDLATVRFNASGEVDCSNTIYLPTETEQLLIKQEWMTVQWPQLKKLKRIINPPFMIANSKQEDIYEFRDTEGDIVMVQVRVQSADGGKNYVPWTYWDDDQWRSAEPEGPLPIFNADKIKDASIAIIHEGGKAARACQEMIEAQTPAMKAKLGAHPWGRELQDAVHLGWIGGALSPYRTDWSLLQKHGIKRAYIVADNDEPGRSAVPAISQQLRCPTFTIQFTDEFPASFDLADTFPKSMFAEIDGTTHYVGPAWRDCLHPATWATDLLPNPKGKPTPILRDSFRNMWAYVEEADAFVCTEMPEIIRSEAILNKMLAPFSHASETSRLITRAYRGRSTRICYRPDQEGLTVTFRGSSAINLHVPTTVRPSAGDPRPWIEFLEYMFVIPEERKKVERWLATLIARPDVRMGYGLLLVTEHQGMGKNTLGSIIAPLVGVNNVGYPSENDILSPFNAWVANKRMVFVGEIYSGSSWKAYHALKSVVTDKDIEVNQKYMRPYVIENWCHVIACSNSMRPLKMENDDRRWFYPEMTEVAWSQAKFTALRNWVQCGGLSIVKQWAESYGDYVHQSERAPMTDRKQELIEGSRSDAQKESMALASLLNDMEVPAALTIKSVVSWIKNSIQGKTFDSDYEIRRSMVEAGLSVYPKRVKISGHLQYVLMNTLLADRVQRTPDEAECNKIVRDSVVLPNSVLPSSM